MQPGQAFAFLCCVGTVLALVFGFEVVVFRMACALCRVPQPGLARTVGMVSVLLVVPAVVDAVFGGMLYEVYRLVGFPLWEAGLVQFFLALPVHMAICSAIHAKMAEVRVSQGLAVWLVEKLLKLTLLVVVVGALALMVLAGQAA